MNVIFKNTKVEDRKSDSNSVYYGDGCIPKDMYRIM